MENHNAENQKGEKIKNILANPRRRNKLSDDKRREFIARLYKVGEEKKSLTDFVPVRNIYALSGASAVLVLLIIAFNFFFMPLYPTVTNIEGTVKIYRASHNEWVFAQAPKMKLGKNDILKTFGDGQADLVIPNVYHIRLKNDSEIRLAKSISRVSSKEIGYSLEKGKILAYYNKHRSIGKELSIETPQAVATALGTDFMVASTPILGQTTVGVLDGVVKVNSIIMPGIKLPGQTVMVRAGERTVVHKGESPDKPIPLPEEDLLGMEELYSIGVRPQVALLISTGPARTRELLSVTPLYVTSETSGLLPRKLETMVKDFNRAIREKSKEKRIESINQFEEVVNKYPNPKYDVQFLLFIGSYYEYIGEYQKSVATFERVVRGYPRSSLVSIAQCAIGIIYEEKLKDPEKAKVAYRKVLSNYPQSPEAEEATAGLNRLAR